jgi:hypothetical protein
MIHGVSFRSTDQLLDLPDSRRTRESTVFLGRFVVPSCRWQHTSVRTGLLAFGVSIMANKLELAILATGSIYRSTPVARFSTSERRGLCATSTLLYSIPRPAQCFNRLLSSIHRGLMSPVAPLPTLAKVIVGQSGSRYRVLETL